MKTLFNIGALGLTHFWSIVGDCKAFLINAFEI